jgi:hypothetical protein
MKKGPPGKGGPQGIDKCNKQTSTYARPSTPSRYFPPEIFSGVARSKTGRRPISLPRLPKFMGGADD